MLLLLTTDITICVLGVVINLYFLYKVAIRPVLWTTTNIFICGLLSLNTLYLLGNLVLTVDNNIEEHSEPLLHVMDLLYLDIYNSRLCAAKYIMGHIYRLQDNLTQHPPWHGLPQDGLDQICRQHRNRKFEQKAASSSPQCYWGFNFPLDILQSN